jgi:hypothetical protein
MGKPTLLKAEAFGTNLPDPHPSAMNSFVGAVHEAFAHHYPLTLSPDDVWIAIIQAFAIHVSENSEALRGQFVRHEGKAVLRVRRDNFVKGSPENDWPGCFMEFSNQIAGYIGKKRDLVVSAFSTTGPVEWAVSEVVLMGAMKNYFDYRVMTKCGIPEITLLGSTEDWKFLRLRASQFSEFDLDWWTKELIPVLDHFVRASEGRPDPRFWEGIYKEQSMSGGDRINGWISVFFPYLVQNKVYSRNNDLLGTRNWGVTADQFPGGMTEVPFTWEYLGSEIQMGFAGGFVGIHQEEDSLAVRPVLGWTVTEINARA